MQCKCTSVLVETEKNAHSQSNAVSFAVTIFLPGLTGSELRLTVVQEPYSVRRLTNLRFSDFFVFTLSSFWSVFMDCYCIYGLPVSRCSEWSTLNGLLRCIFRVLRVSSFNGLYSAPRPFLLTLTTVNVDNLNFDKLVFLVISCN